MRKSLFIAVVLLFAAMMVAPVLAVGPIKSNVDKNKNLEDETATGTSVRMKNPGSVFHEWLNMEPREWHLQRRDASKVNIGNAVEGQFETVQPYYNIFVFREYENQWLYLTQAQYENMLMGFGATPEKAEDTAAPFTEGVYFKLNFIGMAK